MLKHYKLIYLIIYHKDKDQLSNLISQIINEHVLIYIHVDRKVDIRELDDLKVKFPIRFVNNRVNVRWGSFSVIQSNLNGFKQILLDKLTFDHMVILSGQDFPLVSNHEIMGHFSNYDETSFVHHINFQDKCAHLLDRVSKYHFFLPNNKLIVYPYSGNNKLKTLINILLAYLKPLKLPRDISEHKTLYFGSNWVKLSYKATNFINHYCSSNSLTFFKQSFIPDEIFYQTILLNATETERGKIINENLTFTHWDRPDDLYPKPLDLDDLPRLKVSKKLFARKYDSVLSKDLLIKVKSELIG